MLIVLAAFTLLEPPLPELFGLSLLGDDCTLIVISPLLPELSYDCYKTFGVIQKIFFIT